MSTVLRIASFNLENLDDKPGREPDLATRIAILRPQIERLRADILCLQEVNGQHVAGHKSRRLTALAALLDGTPYRDFQRSVSEGVHHGPMDVHNLVILSRFPILEARQYLHDLVEAPRFRTLTADPPTSEAQPVVWDRPILYARLDVGDGRGLDLFNVHFRAPLAAFIPGQKSQPFAWKSVAGWAEGYYLAAMKRSGQALETRLAIESCFERDDGALVCVAGDFNAGLDEMPLRIVVGAEEDTGSGDLAGHGLVPLELSLSADRRHSVIHHGRRQMLDHILASRNLAGRFRRFEAHNEALGDELVGYLSCYRPLSG
ncbi:MAG: endonuclease/exonuclease/phosphatase family protein [Alphaproteobacteria bacterium]|jgi:endonuclease/exonuclease/phosphatase family metal-dependent hydrolase|nr:endonuclease/exonuclease/phosphatase family protein [Alphaproteobacteria bacterium]MDP6813279.1 endonuclease/exonuclease/phosphatase family protein [Alphaproteobacteria bacterium]